MITADTTAVTADTTLVLASGGAPAPPRNAALAFVNLADAAALTASSAAPFTPVTQLRNQHVGRRWRGVSGNTEYVIADLGVSQEIDTVAVMGLNLNSANITRVRVSAYDPSGFAGDVYDTGPVPGVVDPAYGMLVVLMPAVFFGRYVRIDLESPGSAYVEAGRLFVGKRHHFAQNYAFGWSRGYVDRSRRTTGRGGQTYIDRGATYRTIEVTFEAVRASQRHGFVEDMDRLNGSHTDVLFIADPSSPNLGRDSLWGLIEEVSPVQQPAGWLAGEAIYSKTYKILERL